MAKKILYIVITILITVSPLITQTDTVDSVPIVINTDIDRAFAAVIDKDRKEIVKSGIVRRHALMTGIQFGEYIVAVNSKEFGMLTQEVTIDTVEMIRLNFNFLGSLIVNCSHTGAELFINGEKTGTLPLLLENQKTGKYKLRAEAPGYYPEETSIKLKVDGAVVDFQLKEKSGFGALARSFFLPGWGQWYAGRKGESVLLFLAEIGAAAGATYFHIKYDNARKGYNTAFDDYKTSLVYIEEKRKTALQKHRDYDKAYDRMTYAVYSVAGIWLYNVLDSYIFMPRLERNPQFGVIPEINTNIFQNKIQISFVLIF